MLKNTAIKNRIIVTGLTSQNCEIALACGKRLKMISMFITIVVRWSTYPFITAIIIMQKDTKR